MSLFLNTFAEWRIKIFPIFERLFFNNKYMKKNLKEYGKIFFIYFYICVSPVVLFSQNEEEKISVFHKISSNDMKDWVVEMTSSRYKGRLAGSPDYMEIAVWAADLFKQWGLKPMGDSGTYFQTFTRPWCEVKDAGYVHLISANILKKLIVKEEYYPGANPANGKIKSSLVFAGYGISCPELNYDDYSGLDVKGKIVLIAGDVPYKGSNNDTSAIWTFYNSHRYKFTNAYKQGAAGVLVVDMMASPGTPYFPDFYYASVSMDVANYVFEKVNYNFDSIIKQISATMKPFSFQTNTAAEIKTNTAYYEKGLTANVIGFLEGNDPLLKEEVIIIGAHLDGQGYLGFHLPGALDNASGVADVLAAAKALAAMKGKMKRSIMFILFGGEECGLLGSLHYANNPTCPLEKIILMINLDMVGNGNGLAVWGGKSYPQMLKHFEENNEKFLHRTFKSSENKPVKGRPRTDGLVFLMRGIPTVHMGITNREFPVYYHSYKDTYEVLSWETMEDAAKLLFLSVFSIANE